MNNQNNKDVLKGELLAHGADNYLHDPSKSMNYYAQIRQDDGTIKERWSKNLEDVIKDSNVKIGDTIILTELGKEPIQVGDKTFNKTIWDLQKYEPVLELPNTIEHDEKELLKSIPDTDKTKENAPNQPKKTPNLSDFADFELPSNIKNNYIAIVKNRHLSDQKINYYDKDDKDQVNIAFEDRNKSLHTSRQDEKTIYAMLDMAQSKGWSDIKLKGTEEFKQKAWLEASLRGIGVKGYEPNEKDLAQLQAKQAERTTNQVEMTAQKTPETKQENGRSQTEIQSLATPPTHTPTGQETIYGQLQKPMDNQAYLDKIGLDFDGAKMERQAGNRQEAQKQAENFAGQELVNVHSGVRAIISNKNISKMASGKAFGKSVSEQAHWVAVANADKLFENSVFAWQYQDRNEDINIDAIHRAIAPMKFNDEIYIAKLTIKELARGEGNRVYSVEAVDIEQSKSPIPIMTHADQDKQGFTQHRSNGALIDIIVQNAQEYNRQNQKIQENLQNNNINDRFTFEPMTALDVGIGDSEHLRQATHITDMETGEHYIIGNYDFEYNGEVHTGIIAEYYTNDKALTERDDNALIGGERIFYKLGIDDKLLISHIDGENKLTSEEIDKLVSLERLRDEISNQPVMPTKEFQVVSDNARQAGFDSKELSLAQTAMLNNYTVAWDRLDQTEKYERLAMSIENVDDRKYNIFIDNLQKSINQDLSYLKQEVKDNNQEIISQKSATEIKNDIRQIIQNGYRDGSIKSRDEIVLILKERGFEVKENEKSIRVSVPNSDQAVNLKGEMFTKGYDAIKSLKENLEPEKLKQIYPTLKDSDIVHITAYKNKLFDDNKKYHNPKVLQASLVQLENSIKSLAKGKELNLPSLPVNEIKPDIQVRTTENNDKSRQI